MILKVDAVAKSICEAPAVLKGTPPGIFPVTLLKFTLGLNAWVLRFASCCGVALKLGPEGSPVAFVGGSDDGPSGARSGSILDVDWNRYLIYEKETVHFKREDES